MTSQIMPSLGIILSGFLNSLYPIFIRNNDLDLQFKILLRFVSFFIVTYIYLYVKWKTTVGKEKEKYEEYFKNIFSPNILRVSTLNYEVKKPPFLIKIDVEGYETSVLKGAENILKNNELCGVIMELNGSGKRYGYDESLILSMMTDYGFEAYSYDPIDRKFIALNGKNFTEGN